MTGSTERQRAEAELSEGLEALHLTLSSAQRGQLLDYLALLAKWNRVYNLTAIREPERMVTHHLLDSLAALPWLDARAGDGRPALRVLDVGSGGGLPGFPLAIARPAWSFVLLEASHKKGSFLIQAAGELGLSNVDVHIGRVEDAALSPGFDIVASRAFSDLATFAALAGRHVAPGGVLVAFKGLHPAEEIAELPTRYAVIETPSLAVPGVDAARHLIVIEPKDRA